MSEPGREQVEQMHREALERPGGNPSPPLESPRGIPYTALPERKPGEALAEEWNTYRREVARLLEAGQEGKFILIKGSNVVGLFDTWKAAYEEGLKRYLTQPMLVQEVRSYEPILQVRGYNLPWPSLPSQSLEPG